MAISKNLYTRGLKQRLAGAVWYQQKGRTLVRELAASVENPQTESQMDNRVKLANVVACYRANMGWMEKYAFELKKQSWSTYNAFVSANLAKNDIYLTRGNVDAQAGVVAPYIYLKGSLPSVQLVWDDDISCFQSDLYVGQDFGLSAATTVADLSEALLANNSNLRVGDQISFILNIQQFVEGTPRIAVEAFEMIIDTEDATRLIDIFGGNDELLSVGEFNLMPALAFNRDVNYDELTQGCIICVSRDDGSSVKVSTQTMVMTDTNTIANYTGDTARARARRSYAPVTSNPFLAAGYQGPRSESSSLPAITSAAINSGNYVAAGGVLGPAPSGSFNLKIKFAEAIPDDIELNIVTITAETTAGNKTQATVTSASISVADDVATISVGSATSISRDNNISKILVISADEQEVSADFVKTIDE